MKASFTQGYTILIEPENAQEAYMIDLWSDYIGDIGESEYIIISHGNRDKDGKYTEKL